MKWTICATPFTASWCSFMQEERTTIQRSINLLFIAQNLERIADHATNIAEDVLFLVKGIDVRHHAEAREGMVGRLSHAGNRHSFVQNYHFRRRPRARTASRCERCVRLPPLNGAPDPDRPRRRSTRPPRRTRTPLRFFASGASSSIAHEPNSRAFSSMRCFISSGCGPAMPRGIPLGKSWRPRSRTARAASLGWSAEWRKRRLTAADRRGRTRRWREYCCESFCDTAAWLYSGVERHDEFTLAGRCRKTRSQWFVRTFSAGQLPI